MNGWKELIYCLASGEKIMAHWIVKSGANFYMYVPSRDRMGDSSLTNESVIGYDELEYIDILSEMKLGAFVARNHIDACREAILGCGFGKVEQVDGGIRVSLQK
jgi:hypothetical protein